MSQSDILSGMRTVLWILVLMTWLLASGCHKPLFPKTAPRTQFETYDRIRNRYTPLEEPDIFGNPQPALRARLSQAR
jgi:hypothetical protein